MQALLGTRTAADINLVLQLLLLAGLLVGYVLARRKEFERHGNVQTAMVLINLVLIVVAMVPSFYSYVVEGATTTGTVATLMIIHGVVGLVVEVVAIYLILRMRTQLIPKPLRVRNIKLVMRATLALWVALVVVGVGIYLERFIFTERAAATAPLLQFRQLGADLYVHAVELDDAVDRFSVDAARRHAEHLINLVEGESGARYGDGDADGTVEDPGDGIGLRQRLGAVAAVASDATAAEREALGEQLDRIVALSDGVLGEQDLDSVRAPVGEILELARRANGEGVLRIDLAARSAGVMEDPSATTVAPSGGPSGAPGEATVHEVRFKFAPEVLTVPAGSTVVFVNDEQPKHTATADDGSFDSGDQSMGDAFPWTFGDPGTYLYYCRFHGDAGGVGMSGTIVVQ